MLYLLERPDQKVELKTIDMVLFFRSVVWFSVCVWGAQTDPPLCGERMIEGGWRWKCSNTGWCTRCRHPPPCAHNHHYSTKPRPTPTAPPSPSHCDLFFSQHPLLFLSAVWHHYLSREEPTSATASHKTQRRARDTVWEWETEREAERGGALYRADISS